MKRPKESAVEERLVRKIKAIGGMALKWPAIGKKGVPDRIIIHPAIGTVFVEVKREPNQEATILQQHVQDEIRRAGGIAFVVGGYEEVDQFIEFVVAYGKDENVAVRKEQSRIQRTGLRIRDRLGL